MKNNPELRTQLFRIIEPAIFNKDDSHYLDVALGELEALVSHQVVEARKVPSTVDRFEVIDDTGRAYVTGSIYGTPVKVELSYQDENRTLKVFLTQRREG